MVVARKTPVAPAPSSSRSSSSQQPSKPAKSKTPPVAIASSNINGKATVPSKKSKSPSPKEQKRTESSSSFKWFILVLSAFVFYAVSTCPSDIPRTSNVCHSLDLYKTHIIDPYIVPPIGTLLHHADPYIAPIKPYASSAAELARTHVVPRASALLDFTLEKYNTHVAPQLYWFFVDQYWNGIIKPIYYKGFHPHLEYHSRAYRIYYRRFIVPGVKKAAARVNATYIRLRPHVERFLSQAWGHTINAYEKARPYFIKAYRRVRPHAIALVQKAKFYVLVLARKGGDARRQYVDPHILRIWEKVSEPSNASPYYETATPKPTQALEDEPTTFSSSTVIKSVIPTPEPPATTAEAVADPSPEQEAEPEVTIPQEETAAPEPTTTSQPYSSSKTDLPLPSAPVHATPVPPAEHEAEFAASVVAASLHAGAAAAQITPEPNSQPESELELDSEGLQSTDDVVDFLRDIGISEDGENVAAEPVVEKEQVVEEVNTEPERPSYGDPEPSPEERRALTANKRAQITLRHEKWQADLDALVRENMHAVRALLSESRGAAVAHLAQWGPNQKGVVAEVESEAGRLLKGLEGYLKGVEEKADKMKKAGTKQEKEQRDKDREMWNKVVEKVEIRMAEKVRDIHKEVHDWFVGVHEREIQEIDMVSGNVKALASRAQADLGLDYAWLDDVTYYDWQKYHDLMRTSENFTSQAQKIQAQIEPQGTNELIDALNDLEREVDEAVEGFNVFIANVRRRVEGDDGVFGINADELEPERKIKEVREPEVSILPIEPEKKFVPVPVENVFVGRAKEEVEAQLAGVPVEDVRAGREEL